MAFMAAVKISPGQDDEGTPVTTEGRIPHPSAAINKPICGSKGKTELPQLGEL